MSLKPTPIPTNPHADRPAPWVRAPMRPVAHRAVRPAPRRVVIVLHAILTVVTAPHAVLIAATARCVHRAPLVMVTLPPATVRALLAVVKTAAGLLTVVTAQVALR